MTLFDIIAVVLLFTPFAVLIWMAVATALVTFFPLINEKYEEWVRDETE